MNKIILLVLLLSGLHFELIAQGQQNISGFFEINKPCPPFVLKNVEYYPKKEIRENDFKGKWLILDLWDRYCGGCISVFPKYNEIQHKLGEKVQFVLVGRPDGADGTQLVYKKFREQDNLLFPCAFDLDFFKRFDVSSSPYMIVIDPKGIVRALTSFLTLQNIEDLLAGKVPELQRVYRAHEKRITINYDATVPLLIHENGGDDTAFLYRCLVAKYDPRLSLLLKSKIKDSLIANNPRGQITEAKAIEYNSTIGRKFEVMGASLLNLFSYAYLGTLGGPHFGDSLYGELWPKYDLEIPDTSQFQVDDYPSSKNRFCFSLILPETRDTREDRMKVMQRELLNYFGYYGDFEDRKMPYWRLVASTEAKIDLKTKGGTPSRTSKGNKFQTLVSIRNSTISDLIYYYLSSKTHMPIIDETGINGNIDINLDIPTMFSSLEDIKSVLEKNGLDLIEGKKTMKVLVIKEVDETTVSNVSNP